MNSPSSAASKTANRSSARATLWSALADVIAVLVFVAIGRRNHDGTVDPEGVFDVATPFLVALAIMWIIVLWRRLHPTAISTGVIIWVGVVTVGMILRKFVFDGGTATAFVIVATIFIGVAVNGWRALANRFLRESS